MLAAVKAASIAMPMNIASHRPFSLGSLFTTSDQSSISMPPSPKAMPIAPSRAAKPRAANQRSTETRPFEFIFTTHSCANGTTSSRFFCSRRCSRSNAFSGRLLGNLRVYPV